MSEYAEEAGLQNRNTPSRTPAQRREMNEAVTRELAPSTRHALGRGAFDSTRIIRELAENTEMLHALDDHYWGQGADGGMYYGLTRDIDPDIDRNLWFITDE